MGGVEEEPVWYGVSVSPGETVGLWVRVGLGVGACVGVGFFGRWGTCLRRGFAVALP